MKANTSFEHHSERAIRLETTKCAMAFAHFLGALQVMLAPASIVNKGPTREQIALALERAVNSQTGT